MIILRNKQNKIHCTPKQLLILNCLILLISSNPMMTTNNYLVRIITWKQQKLFLVMQTEIDFIKNILYLKLIQSTKV